MSYIKPSVLVSQDLVNPGGVLNSTPDLEACIIGPLNQVVSYVPGSLVSQINTAALSTSSTTATALAGSYTLSAASSAGFYEGDSILLVGAGDAGSTLQATITALVGSTITVDTAVVTAVEDAILTKTGKIVNPAINNTFVLANRKPGQVVDPTSVSAWLNNVKVETFTSAMEGFFSSNFLSVTSVTTTGSISAASNTLTVASSVGLLKGDTVSITGAGQFGGNPSILTTKIVNITSNTITVANAASYTVSNVQVVKVALANMNSSTNSLRVEPGDSVLISYTNIFSDVSTMSTTVKSVATTSGQNGTVTSIEVLDMLDYDVSIQTTGSISANTATLTLTSISGLAEGSKLLIRGAGSEGTDMVANIISMNGSVATLNVPAQTTVAGAVVIESAVISLSVRKTYNDQQLPSVKPISGGNNLNVSSASATGQVTILAGAELAYGPVISANVHFSYVALRTDLSGRVLTFDNASDLEGQVGDTSDLNPVGLACLLALANTTTRVRAIAVSSNDLAGYLEALEISEGERVYALVALTQDLSIIEAFQAHVEQLSTPENASWRVALVNTDIPTVQNIGQWSESFPNSNNGNNEVMTINGNVVLSASNATFISDGVTAGDSVVILDSSVSGLIGSHTVLEVLSNQQVVLSASLTGSDVVYYVERSLSKTETATVVKAKSENFGSNRVWHIQPDTVGVSINGVVKYLPGYYLAAAHSGEVAGFPVQQGFTNVGVAGISDLKFSNFYFSKANLNSMAEGGTCLYVQDTQTGTPYCRHSLTTDVTVLEYREQLIVKNWDFLAYFYYDKLKGFIGRWNITPDTINTIRQTIIASSELLKTKKLPRIGAPLLDYSITSIAQNPNNKDNLDVYLQVSLVSPLNYLNLHLVI